MSRASSGDVGKERGGQSSGRSWSEGALEKRNTSGGRVVFFSKTRSSEKNESGEVQNEEIERVFSSSLEESDLGVLARNWGDTNVVELFFELLVRVA